MAQQNNVSAALHSIRNMVTLLAFACMLVSVSLNIYFAMVIKDMNNAFWGQKVELDYLSKHSRNLYDVLLDVEALAAKNQDARNLLAKHKDVLHSLGLQKDGNASPAPPKH